MKAIRFFLPAVLLSLVACGGGGGDETPKTYSVQYQVTSVFTTPVALTYQNDSGGVQQEKVNTPFGKTFTFERGEFVYLSAQNQSAFGAINVSIKANGREIYSATTSAPYGVATEPAARVAKSRSIRPS